MHDVLRDLITLQQAAEIAGYANTAPGAAAAKGRLKSVKPGPRLYMTTRAWLEDYLASLRGGNYKRGQARTDGDAHAAQSLGNGAA